MEEKEIKALVSLITDEDEDSVVREGDDNFCVVPEVEEVLNIEPIVKSSFKSRVKMSPGSRVSNVESAPMITE